ncbi:MAG: hypothetical protein R6W73_01050 [Candidatus Saliniplasma sp.]
MKSPTELGVSMEEDFIQIFVTVDDEGTAKEIAGSLVSKKLVIPPCSTF